MTAQPSQLPATSARPASGAVVNIRALRHSFGAVDALKAVDVSIEPGEFVALLGPSGCGKTTLLRCIAGLVLPTSGEILIDGLPITRTPVHKRDLGMVFQSYALFPHMTVRDNVQFGLKMQGIRGEVADRRIAEALALVQMAGFESRYPAQLSGGQRQRVALARALVTHPKALLLDEPFGALDAKLRESMQIELRRLLKTLGITTIFVTHDQQEALGMADRVAVMHDGRIEQFDTPARIYNSPATPFVADFIGQTNRIGGTIRSMNGGRMQLQLDGPDQPIDVAAAPGLSAGDRVVAMVRPECVYMAFDAAASTSVDISLSGKIADVLFVGEKVSVYVQTVAGTIAASLLNPTRRDNRTVVAGADVTVGWRKDDLMIFRHA